VITPVITLASSTTATSGMLNPAITAATSSSVTSLLTAGSSLRGWGEGQQ
jgi:hypothetical protein